MKQLKLLSALLIATILTFTSKAQIHTADPYCTSLHRYNYNMIDSMNFESFNFSFGACGSTSTPNIYTYYNRTTLPTVTLGARATIKLKMYNVPNEEPIYFAVWIDINHNDFFEYREIIMENSTTIMRALPTVTGDDIWIEKTFTIPTTAELGTTRMRIMRTSDPFSMFYDDFYWAYPCVEEWEGSYGCTYDFNLDIVRPAAVRPIAGFRASATAGTTTTLFNLTDTSLNTPTSWEWSFTPATVAFVGGTTATSRNPQVQFTAPGTYTARLIASNAIGSDTANRVAYFNVTPAIRPIAGFRASATSGTTASIITLTDTSRNDPTSWSWSFTPATVTFAGGTSASSRNPLVIFTAPGSYSARLIATNIAGSDTTNRIAYFNITPIVYRPIAGFRASATAGTTATIFDITDTSLNVPTGWSWSFIPATVTYIGGTSATSRNPQVQFTAAGSYSAILVVTNTAGLDSVYRFAYFTISPAVIRPIAGFTASATTGTTTTIFNLTDTSLNTPTGWTWSFTPATVTYIGGTTATSRNPQVQFNVPGTYTARLIASNTAGADTAIRAAYFNITPAILRPIAGFRSSSRIGTTATIFNLIDTSLHAPTSWRWSFTPATVTFVAGTSATSQNPQVVFNVPGFYAVKLVATNTAGSDSVIIPDYFDISDIAGVAPIANFTVSSNLGTTATVFSFTDASINAPTSWLWSFTPNTITYQPGFNQNSQNPKIVCNAPGNYTVKLVARNAAGVDSIIKLNYIVISTLGINEMNAQAFNIYPNPASNVLYCSNDCINASIQILNFNGIKVMEIPSLHQNAIDVSSLPIGVYILNIANENASLSKTLSIIR